MKNTKLTILVGLLAVSAIGFVGLALMNQSSGPNPITIMPESVTAAIQYFENKLDYPYARKGYVKILDKINKDENITQPR